MESLWNSLKEWESLRADLATLQAAYDTAAEENHHAYHAVIPGLQAELAAARERIAKLEFIMNEGKRLVTTRTTKAGVDYFRELCRKHEAGEV